VRALVAVAAGALLLTGCSGRGERYYQRAEQFFIQGQYRLAGEEYRRVLAEAPRSPLADDAAYKLAYLYREETNDLPQAIQTYLLLADQYPDSPFANDALLWVMYLQGQKLKDPGAARRTYDLICQRFSDDKDTCARADLQLVKTLVATGDLAGADTEARRLLTLYPGQRRPAAAAILLRARLAGKLSKSPERAVKLYEQLVNDYPDTLSAAEAKREIGWIYYGQHGQQLQAEHRALQRAAREIAGVPDPGVGSGSSRTRPFACLRALLAQRGVRVSLEEVLAVAGVAFEFYYAPDRPRVTLTRLARNALSDAAEQYGFAAITWSAPSADASFASLAQSISQGRPVMVPEDHNGRWLVVTGQRPAEKLVYLLPGRNGRPRAVPQAEFLELWASSPEGHAACVTGPYFQFSLGDRLQPAAPEALLRAAAQRGLAAAREGKPAGVAAGLQAYDALADQLAAMASRQSPGDPQHLRQWAAEGLPALVADRRAAVAYLTAAAQSVTGGAQGSANEAAGAYQEVVDLGPRLQSALLSLTRPAQGAEPPPEVSWPEAAQLVRQMRAAEERAVEQLSNLAR
jgi:tetratricopeptide (TPR) repeat protein